MGLRWDWEICGQAFLVMRAALVGWQVGALGEIFATDITTSSIPGHFLIIAGDWFSVILRSVFDFPSFSLNPKRFGGPFNAVHHTVIDLGLRYLDASNRDRLLLTNLFLHDLHRRELMILFRLFNRLEGDGRWEMRLTRNVALDAYRLYR